MGNFLFKRKCFSYEDLEPLPGQSKKDIMDEEIRHYIDLEMMDMNKKFIEKYGEELIRMKLIETYFTLTHNKPPNDMHIPNTAWIRRFDKNPKI